MHTANAQPHLYAHRQIPDRDDTSTATWNPDGSILPAMKGTVTVTSGVKRTAVRHLTHHRGIHSRRKVLRAGELWGMTPSRNRPASISKTVLVVLAGPKSIWRGTCQWCWGGNTNLRRAVRFACRSPLSHRGGGGRSARAVESFARLAGSWWDGGNMRRANGSAELLRMGQRRRGVSGPHW